MQNIIIILSLITLSFNQDREVIFFTGEPSDSSTAGHEIFFNGTVGNSVADRFTTYNDVTLEGFGIWMGFTSERATILTEIRDDESGYPGDILGEWTIGLDSLSSGFYTISTVAECIYLEGSQNYWLTLHAADTNTQAIWYYPSIDNDDEETYYYKTSYDAGLNWNVLDSINVGAATVSGEQIFISNIETYHGDVNFDESVDILDLVMVVSYVLGNQVFIDEQFDNTDINHDLSIDILDIVIIVDILLWGMPNFSYDDINPNSIYYGQNIGHSFFTGNVVAYYFGKAG